ncbi:MAG TPA: hypothetical protein VEQ12_07360 [Candidatus Limnocylindria bacterium]|nr:hypothetical protein [Candidatus Limnocylindria bacterium]
MAVGAGPHGALQRVGRLQLPRRSGRRRDRHRFAIRFRLGIDPHRLMQARYHIRVGGVVLHAGLVVLVEAGALQRGRDREAGGVAGQRIGGQVGKGGAAQRRRRSPEAQVDDLAGQSEGIEDLGASVAVEGGDSHLG